MDPLLLSVGIKETGFPSLSEIVSIHPERMEKIEVDASKWPRDPDGVPRFASKRVVLYHYSQSTYEVSVHISLQLVIGDWQGHGRFSAHEHLYDLPS
jgi:hypothetical protein